MAVINLNTEGRIAKVFRQQICGKKEKARISAEHNDIEELVIEITNTEWNRISFGCQ